MKKKMKMISDKRSIHIPLVPMLVAIVTVVVLLVSIFSGNKGKELNLDISMTEAEMENYAATTSTSSLKVGDYVNYSPITSGASSWSSTYTNYSSTQAFSYEDFDWRVLNINSDGTVDLISTSPSSAKLYFSGASSDDDDDKGVEQYNCGVYILNSICKSLYSNSSLNATARSLSILDVQDKISDKTLYTKNGGNDGHEYGSTSKFTYEGWGDASLEDAIPADWRSEWDGVDDTVDLANRFDFESEDNTLSTSPRWG